MVRIILIFLFLFFTTNASPNNKEKIIQNLRYTQNLQFNFEQNINGKIENGKCTIEYPKKIFCKYSKSNNKILVSDGKALVIKTISSFYRYPLEKTSLNLILDKKFLINKIRNLEERIVDQSFINFTIVLKTLSFVLRFEVTLIFFFLTSPVLIIDCLRFLTSSFFLLRFCFFFVIASLNVLYCSYCKCLPFFSFVVSFVSLLFSRLFFLKFFIYIC